MLRKVISIFFLISCFTVLYGQGNMKILEEKYPRIGFFRQAEYSANIMPLEIWLQYHARLDGIYGKALDEEYIMKKNKWGYGIIDYFNAYKKRYPEKIVLEHFNGSSRCPDRYTKPFFAGHWLYYEGVAVLSDLNSNDDKSIIEVSECRHFSLTEGRYNNNGTDVCITRLVNGKPDWNYSEQATVTAIDTIHRTITLKRGQYGSEKLMFKRGETYIAPHVTEGPFGKPKGAKLLWRYNFSSTAPKDLQGHSCSDVLSDQIAGWFEEGGLLCNFDGIEFDAVRTLWNPQGHYLQHHILLDYNSDGKGDKGVFNNVNIYEKGHLDFFKMLREKMPEGKMIFADLGQTGFKWLDGVESEGFSTNSIYDFINWSDRYNKMEYWANEVENAKFSFIGGRVNLKKGECVPFNVMRMHIAASCFLGIGYFTQMKSAPEEYGEAGIFDEMCKGVENVNGWLGKALDKTQYMIGSANHELIECRERLEQQVSENSRKYIIKDFPYGGNLFLEIEASASMRDDENEIPRQMTINIGTKAKTWQKVPAVVKLGAYVGKTPSVSHFYFAKSIYDQTAPEKVTLNIEFDGLKPVEVYSVRAGNAPVGMYREFENGVVLANLSDESLDFNLSHLFPGQSFKHLEALTYGDHTVNDGSMVSEIVTLPRKDALFLIKSFK